MHNSLSPETVDTLRLVVSFLAPLLVAVVTREVASSRLKSLCLAAITGAQTLVLGFLDSSDLDLNDLVRQFGLDMAIAIATYYGLWKPTGVASSVAHKTADIGFGAPSSPDDYITRPAA